ncbi:hypothetical protein BY996DRAFT_8686053 [Phakopsora pachyrhizi]|nr:hypothetical protein BY996DRAFT_8691750 [Phakopsora pachyrhizi]KAI8452944.1 hypothetical protein BY996DRAFT_8687564 [Phakopsora pachyrhizi]KAI8455937.1 hypothetical protein BY996DRAFT_8686053 [Phakopsora pachyrhizi]
MSLTQSSCNDKPSSNTQTLLDWAKRHSKAAEEAQGRKKELSRLLNEAEQDNNKHSNLKKSLTKAVSKHSDPNKPAPEPQGSHQPIQDQVKDLIMENVNTGSMNQREAARKFKVDEQTVRQLVKEW